MAKRKERDLGSSLGKFVEDKIEDVIDQRQSEEEMLDQVGREDTALKKIISTFPSSEGYYGKLYKMLPSGKMEMKHHFMALEELNDPEIEVAELAKERRWGSGDYKLRVFKQGEAGCQKGLTMRIDVPVEDASGKEISSNFPPQQTLAEKLTELSGVIATVKDILPRSEPTDNRRMGEVLAETFKSGVDAVKGAAADKQGGNGRSTIIELVTVMKELGLIGKEEKKVNEVELVEKILKNLKDMGALKTTEPRDTLSDLIKLRETGLIKLAGEDKEDPLSSLEKIKSMIEIFTPLINPTGEKASFWNTLAPHIPRFIENLASPFRDYIELRKIELQQRIGKPLSPQIRRPMVAPVPLPPQTEGSPQEDIPIQEQRPNVHPIVAEIMGAVASNNQIYFPKLQELIILFIGPHVIPALVSGTVSVDTFLSLVSSSAYGDIFNMPESKTYLEVFIEWVKNQAPSQEAVVAGNGFVPVKCEKCGDELDVALEDWKTDDKICDECGGNLKEMIQVPPAA